MSQLKRPYGIPRVAFEAYEVAAERSKIDIAARDDLRLVQKIGNAPASHGYHHAEFGEGDIARIEGEEYSSCYDASIRGLSWSRIAVWLEELTRVGFAPFYRYKGSFANNQHIHMVFCGVPMKPQCQAQCRDYFRQRDGLVGHHLIDDTLYPSAELVAIPKRMFEQSNGEHQRVVSAPIAQRPIRQSYPLYLGTQSKPALWMPIYDGVALAPVRAYGTALGFDVEWNPKTQDVTFDGRDVPIAHTNIAEVYHSPITQLAAFSGLKLQILQNPLKVVLSR